MNARSFRLSNWMHFVAVCSAGFVLPSDANAQESPPTPLAENVDHNGDPLPTRAKLRLGTVRLRQEQGVNSVAFSPDGTELVSTGWEDSVRFWDVNSGRLVRRFQTNEEEGGSFAAVYSPDGSKLATVGTQGFVGLWDIQTGKELWNQLAHVEGEAGLRVYGIAFRPDGQSFATGGDDQWIRVWDIEGGKQTLALRIEEEGGDARPVAFSPDGSLLATGTSKGTIQIWNLGQGGKEMRIPKAHQRDVTSLAFIDEGRSLVSGGHRFVRNPNGLKNVSEIHVWDVASGIKQAGFATDEELLGDCTIAISPDRSHLASAHHEKIAIWSLPDRALERVIDCGLEYYGGRTHGLAISPNNQLVASGTFGAGDHKIHLWNFPTGEPHLPQEDTHKDAVLAIDVSPDGLIVATGSADNSVRLWNATTGEHLRLLDEGFGWVRYVEFFRDGNRLALGRETHLPGMPSFQGEVKILSVEDGETLHQIQVPDRVRCGALSPTGEVLAVGIGLGMSFEQAPSEIKILTWDTQSGKQISDVKGHVSQIQRLRFGRAPAELFSTSEDQTMRAWNILTGKETKQVMLHHNGGRGFVRTAFVAEGTNVLLGEIETNEARESLGRLMLCDAQTGKPLWQLEFQDSWPAELAVSLDGRIAATAQRRLWKTNGRNRIVIWSTNNGAELQSLELPDGRVRCLAFGPDENLLLSGMDAGDTLVWNIKTARQKLPSEGK